MGGRTTSFFWAVGCATVMPLPVVTRVIAIGVVRIPLLANAVYADAICRGVASAVPRAIAGYARDTRGRPAFAARLITRPTVTSIATSTVTTFKLWTIASRK